MRAAQCLVLLAVAVLVAGCGSFPLGRVRPQAGKTPEQQQLDTLTCKDQAHLASDTAGREVGAFFLGLTIIGTPAAIAMDRAKQREVFASCMHDKGYTVLPPSDDPQQAVPATNAPSPATAVAPSVPGIESLRMEWPAGFEERPLTDVQQRLGVVALAINRAADVGVSVVADRHAGVTDVSTYAVSKRAGWLSRLGEGSATDITLADVGGRKAFRCEGGGVLNGVHVKGIETVIEGTDQIITVLTWTSEANWSNQADLMRALPTKVTGIR